MDYRPVLFLMLMSLQSGATADSLPERLTRLDDAMASIRQELDIPALTLVLVDANNILLANHYGVTDRIKTTPFTDNHYFRIGSITKTITALAVLRLVSEGRLSLDARLVDLAPELGIDNPWQDSHPITVAQLLEHTAGLNDLTRREFEYNEPLSLEQAFKSGPESRQVRWPPGTHHSYSNVSPGLLAYVIQKITGVDFEEYVQRAVLRPLGMDSATFFPGQQVNNNLVTGYDSDGRTPIPYWHMTYRAFGALNIQPVDMAPMLKLFLNLGQHAGSTFLADTLIERMQTPRTTLAARAGLEFGYGFNLYTFLHEGHVFYGHGGDADGYLSHFGYNHDAGLGYFVGINVFRDQDLVRIRNRVEEFIVETLPDPRYPRTDITGDRLQALSGEYVSVTWRFPNAPADEVMPHRLTIRVDGGNLLLQRQGKDDRVTVPVNERLFRFADEPVATMAFVESEGQRYLQTGFGNYRQLK